MQRALGDRAKQQILDRTGALCPHHQHIALSAACNVGQNACGVAEVPVERTAHAGAFRQRFRCRRRRGGDAAAMLPDRIATEPVSLRFVDGILNVDEMQLRIADALGEVNREAGGTIGTLRAINGNEDSIHGNLGQRDE